MHLIIITHKSGHHETSSFACHVGLHEGFSHPLKFPWAFKLWCEMPLNYELKWCDLRSKFSCSDNFYAMKVDELKSCEWLANGKKSKGLKVTTL